MFKHSLAQVLWAQDCHKAKHRTLLVVSLIFISCTLVSYTSSPHTGPKLRDSSPVPWPLTTESHAEVTQHLIGLNNQEQIQLGTLLGLYYSHLDRMSPESRLDGMVHAWLRKDDSVMKATGTPCWRSLANALEVMNLTGVAAKIRESKIFR